MSALPQLTDAALTLEERVAVLTFKRDDVRNALTSTDLTSDIVTTIAWANANPEVSVLVMTGEGSAFSAGGNIKTMGERSRMPPSMAVNIAPRTCLCPTAESLLRSLPRIHANLTCAKRFNAGQ